MRVELTTQVIQKMKAELMRGQSLQGACRVAGITDSSCQLWKGAGEALLDGRPHRGIPTEPRRYSYKSDETYNAAVAKYEERCNLLVQFYLDTEGARGDIQGYMMDVLFRAIEKQDEDGNPKVWLPIFTYLSRAYKGEWSDAVKIEKSVDIKHEVNVSATLDEVNKLYSETAHMEAVKRLSDDSISEEDSEDLKARLRKLGGDEESLTSIGKEEA